MSKLDDKNAVPAEKPPSGQPVDAEVIVQEEYEDEETPPADPGSQKQGHDEAGLRS